MSIPTAEEVRELVVTELCELADLTPEQLTDEATMEELDVDSLDLVELSQIIDERYGVTLKREDFKEIRTVGAAIEVIINRCVGVAA